MEVEEKKIAEGEDEKGLRTKLEVTQEEIFTSSDEQDAQRREEEEEEEEEEEGGELLTLSSEMLKIDVESEIDCNSKMEGSPDWSGKGKKKSRKQYNEYIEWSPTQ